MMNPDPTTAIYLTERLYSQFVQPKKVYLIYFSFSDVTWAQLQFNKYALHPTGHEAANSCQSAATCWGAQSEIDMKGTAILLLSVRGGGIEDLNHSSGTLEAHEFTHAIQGSQFIGTSKEAAAYCCTKSYMPWWLVEGGAEFSQAAALYSDSFANYSSERKNDVGGLFTDATITTSWLETFLKPGSTGDWAKYDNWRIYDVGFLASEVLAALQGPQSIMQLYREVALGKSYEAAFLGIYGISWNDAVPILAQAIHSLINP